MKVVLVTGGFDPLHSGHIAYFNAAKALGDKLIVGLNSDRWLERKKGRAFMPFKERLEIVRNLKMVDDVLHYGFYDEDNSATHAIELVKEFYPGSTIIFANGGDRTVDNIPEMSVKDVIFKFGVGGEDKKNSSSWILDEWKAPKTERPWGYYRVLHEVPGCKVKELTVDPGKSLSMQRHEHRDEYWLVSEGQCRVDTINFDNRPGFEILCQHDETEILAGVWHQLSNPHTKPCRIVEIQYGDRCIEEDIERR
jgi:cytidyltransferase-like protein